MQKRKKNDSKRKAIRDYAFPVEKSPLLAVSRPLRACGILDIRTGSSTKMRRRESFVLGELGCSADMHCGSGVGTSESEKTLNAESVEIRVPSAQLCS